MREQTALWGHAGCSVVRHGRGAQAQGRWVQLGLAREAGDKLEEKVTFLRQACPPLLRKPFWGHQRNR